MSVTAKIDKLIELIDVFDDDANQIEEKKQDSGKYQRELLPSNVRPIHYFVSFRNIDLEKEFKFNGEVKIDLNILENDIKEIIINSAEIEYKSVEVIQNDNTENVSISNLSENKKSQQITIPLTKTLSKGNASLCIKFIGILNDNLHGFYRLEYKLGSGLDAFCGCTHFEPCDARKAFPCWDEPAIKSTFSLQFEYPKNLICISNMPSIKDEDSKNNNKCKIITFDKTPKMSTYLLAWAIGEFEYIESKTSRDIIMRIYTTVGNKNKAQYSLKLAVKCLDFYEKYFDIKYPLPKCDMIGLTDFAIGAMENWGLITFRENYLLCDESTAALGAKQGIARLLCHELSHMWFGNLVTMEWWSQLWLKEGFAQFLMYLSVDAIEPKLNIWNLYITREYSNAFKLDCMVSSHPIEVPVLTAEGAIEVFDTISYCKGSCIVTMLQSFLGDKVFQNGLIKYLNNFKYSTSVTNDLWNFLSIQSNKNINKIMKNWTKCQGFPLIEAKIIDKKNGKLLLKQSRFLLTANNDNDKTIWNVPISMKIDDKIVTILLTEEKQEFIIKEIINSKSFIHLNANSKGFYCTKYDDKMLNSLLLCLDNNNITDFDKICLIRDLTVLSKSCNKKYCDNSTKQLLNLLLAFKNEQSYIVWDELLTAASSINHIINNDEKLQNKFNKIMRNVLFPIYMILNKWGDDDDEKQKNEIERNDIFRPLILSAMAKYKDKEVINVILKKFDEYILNKNNNKESIIIPDALKSMIYSYALKYGDNNKNYDALKLYYMTTNDNMDKNRALIALGYTNNKELLLKTLNWLKDSNDVRKQDKYFIFNTISKSNIGKNIAWEFLKNTISEWKEFYGQSVILNRIIKLPSSFVTHQKANEIETFYNTLKGFESCQKSIKQCIENIRLNANWRESQIHNIEKWINENEPDV